MGNYEYLLQIGFNHFQKSLIFLKKRPQPNFYMKTTLILKRLNSVVQKAADGSSMRKVLPPPLLPPPPTSQTPAVCEGLPLVSARARSSDLGAGLIRDDAEVFPP